MRRVCLVLALIFVTGCESDADKLERLQLESFTACMGLAADERAERETRSRGETPTPESRDLIAEARTECTLAQRELELFLDGR